MVFWDTNLCTNTKSEVGLRLDTSLHGTLSSHVDTWTKLSMICILMTDATVTGAYNLGALLRGLGISVSSSRRVIREEFFYSRLMRLRSQMNLLGISTIPSSARVQVVHGRFAKSQQDSAPTPHPPMGCSAVTS